MLNVGQTTTGHDLAKILEGDQGTFLARNGNQVFSVVAAAGHSIKSGPTPVGPPISGLSISPSMNGDPWVVTKFSEQDITGSSDQHQRRQGQ
jgi:predicted methyltransferase